MHAYMPRAGTACDVYVLIMTVLYMYIHLFYFILVFVVLCILLVKELATRYGLICASGSANSGLRCGRLL